MKPTQTHIPAWLAAKNALKAPAFPTPLDVAPYRAKCIKVNEARPVIRLEEIDQFEIDLPYMGNTGDDVTEGLDTLDYSLSIE
jgi:hypothetical protein